MWEGLQPRQLMASGLKPLPQKLLPHKLLPQELVSQKLLPQKLVPQGLVPQKLLLPSEQAALRFRQCAFQPQQELLGRQAAAEAGQ